MHQTNRCGRRQLHAPVRLRTDGVAEVPQLGRPRGALAAARPAPAGSRRGWTDAPS